MCAHNGATFLLYLTVFLLQALLLSHPFTSTRDTQQFAHKYKLSKGRRPALRNLTAQEFGIQIHGGEHSSVRLILRVRSAAARVFTFPCRSQMLGPQWRYTVYIANSGKKGKTSRYHRPRARIVRTFPEHRRSGNNPTLGAATTYPAVGGRVQAPGSRRWSNVWGPRKRKLRHR